MLVLMIESNSLHTHKSTPPLALLPVLQKIKTVYILWYSYYQTLPKTHRYSLGVRIDNLFVEIIEAVALAGFLGKTEKQPYVRIAIRKLDTLKILLMVVWETKAIDDKKYIALSLPIDEIGKMLGGWNGQLAKQNSLST
ncbi:MAG: four helix bundle protein [Candidatus Paceibacterota bacterium]